MAQRRRCKVFLDSNVLLSGLFSEKGAPRIILDLLALDLPVLAGATGRYNLMEVERNLKKKMPEALQLYHNYLPRLGLEVVALPGRETVRSMARAIAEKDVPVLASAIACGAEYLITGDKKDFARLKRSQQRYNLTIVSPSEFVETVFPKIIRNT
ncbi:MAG: PIN domain-containing protein [Thermodesulfobacteriota bacterium]|jgi:predicted nucleic acid-binding protein